MKKKFYKGYCFKCRKKRIIRTFIDFHNEKKVVVTVCETCGNKEEFLLHR